MLEAIEHLAQAIGVSVVCRSVDRTELLIADEMALVGTITGMTLVKSIDGLGISQPGPTPGKLQKQYLDVVRGVTQHPSIEMTAVPKEKMVSKEALSNV